VVRRGDPGEPDADADADADAEPEAGADAGRRRPALTTAPARVRLAAMALLHHELIASQGGTPRGWLMITHGIFGAGSNWRSIARKLHRARPELGCVLVDLRNHGRSPNPPPPHDLAACADDLGALIDHLADAGRPTLAVAGHSFGGKVTAMLRRRREEHAHVSAVTSWWLLDSSPGARPNAATEPRNSVRDVLATMDALPETFASREAFERAIIAAGHARSLAQWLALSVEPSATGEGWRLRLPLPAMHEMLASYYATDLWPDTLDPAGGEVHLVIAERSTTLGPADRAIAAAAPPHVHVHMVDADHWLHIEAPDAVVALLAAGVPS
jgi:esterase